MKSTLSLFLAMLLLLLSMTACGSTAETDLSTDTDPHHQTEPEIQEETEPPVMNTYQKTTYTMKKAEGLYNPLGRTAMLESSLTCDFPASGAEFKMDCEGKVTFSFTAAKNEQTVNIYIDGAFSHEVTLTKGTSVYTAAENLSKGIHTVRIVAQYAISTCTLNNITLNGKLLPREERDVYIEFIGASSISGYGLSSTQGTEATKSLTYTAIELLDVDYSVFAIGGMGFAHAGDEDNLINKQYPYQNLKRNEDAYVPSRTPDLIVFNLGQNDNWLWYKEANNNINDAEYNYPTFDAEVDRFFKTLDRLYGEKKVPIVFVSGIITQESRAVATNRLEELIKTVYVPAGYDILICPVTTNRDGVSGHSSPAGAKKQGEEVAAFIKTNFRWLFE